MPFWYKHLTGVANVEVITSTVGLRALQTLNIKALISSYSLNHCKQRPKNKFYFQHPFVPPKLPFEVRIKVAGAKNAIQFSHGTWKWDTKWISVLETQGVTVSIGETYSSTSIKKHKLRGMLFWNYLHSTDQSWKTCNMLPKAWIGTLYPTIQLLLWITWQRWLPFKQKISCKGIFDLSSGPGHRNLPRNNSITTDSSECSFTHQTLRSWQFLCIPKLRTHQFWDCLLHAKKQGMWASCGPSSWLDAYIWVV